MSSDSNKDLTATIQGIILISHEIDLEKCMIIAKKRKHRASFVVNLSVNFKFRHKMLRYNISTELSHVRTEIVFLMFYRECFESSVIPPNKLLVVLLAA